MDSVEARVSKFLGGRHSRNGVVATSMRSTRRIRKQQPIWIPVTEAGYNRRLERKVLSKLSYHREIISQEAVRSRANFRK